MPGEDYSVKVYTALKQHYGDGLKLTQERFNEKVSSGDEVFLKAVWDTPGVGQMFVSPGAMADSLKKKDVSAEDIGNVSSVGLGADPLKEPAKDLDFAPPMESMGEKKEAKPAAKEEPKIDTITTEGVAQDNIKSTNPLSVHEAVYERLAPENEMTLSEMEKIYPSVTAAYNKALTSSMEALGFLPEVDEGEGPVYSPASVETANKMRRQLASIEGQKAYLEEEKKKIEARRATTGNTVGLDKIEIELQKLEAKKKAIGVEPEGLFEKTYANVEFAKHKDVVDNYLESLKTQDPYAYDDIKKRLESGTLSMMEQNRFIYTPAIIQEVERRDADLEIYRRRGWDKPANKYIDLINQLNALVGEAVTVADPLLMIRQEAADPGEAFGPQRGPAKLGMPPEFTPEQSARYKQIIAEMDALVDSDGEKISQVMKAYGEHAQAVDDYSEAIVKFAAQEPKMSDWERIREGGIAKAGWNGVGMFLNFASDMARILEESTGLGELMLGDDWRSKESDLRTFLAKYEHYKEGVLPQIPDTFLAKATASMADFSVLGMMMWMVPQLRVNAAWATRFAKIPMSNVALVNEGMTAAVPQLATFEGLMNFSDSYVEAAKDDKISLSEFNNIVGRTSGGIMNGLILHEMGIMGRDIGKFVQKIAATKKVPLLAVKSVGTTAGAATTSGAFSVYDAFHQVQNRMYETGETFDEAVREIDWVDAGAVGVGGLALSFPHLMQSYASDAYIHGRASFLSTYTDIKNVTARMQNKTAYQIFNDVNHIVKIYNALPKDDPKRKPLRNAIQSYTNLLKAFSMEDDIRKDPRPFYDEIEANNDLTNAQREYLNDVITTIYTSGPATDKSLLEATAERLRGSIEKLPEIEKKLSPAWGTTGKLEEMKSQLAERKSTMESRLKEIEAKMESMTAEEVKAQKEVEAVLFKGIQDIGKQVHPRGKKNKETGETEYNSELDLPVQKSKWHNTPKELLTYLFKNDNWAFLSAEKHGDKDGLTPEENAARTAELEGKLKEMGAKYVKIAGKYGSPESSFLIIEIAPEDAIKLSKDYDQQSVATGTGLIYTDGSNTVVKRSSDRGAVIEGVHDKKMDDNFSIVQVGNKQVKFSMNYDWDTGQVPYEGTKEGVKKEEGKIKEGKLAEPMKATESDITQAVAKLSANLKNVRVAKTQEEFDSEYEKVIGSEVERAKDVAKKKGWSQQKTDKVISWIQSQGVKGVRTTNPETGEQAFLINPREATKDTPWHEMGGHPFIDNLKESNPTLYNVGLALIKGTEYHKMAKDLEYSNAPEEALVWAIGDLAAQKVRSRPELMTVPSKKRDILSFVVRAAKAIGGAFAGKQKPADVFSVKLGDFLEASAKEVISAKGKPPKKTSVIQAKEKVEFSQKQKVPETKKTSDYIRGLPKNKVTLDNEDNVVITHYGPKDLSVVMAQAKPSSYSNAEFSTWGRPRWFGYTGKFSKEKYLPGTANTVKIPVDKLYPLTKDPLGIFKQAQKDVDEYNIKRSMVTMDKKTGVMIAKYPDIPMDRNAFELAAKRAEEMGYEGFVYDHPNGTVVSVWADKFTDKDSRTRSEINRLGSEMMQSIQKQKLPSVKGRGKLTDTQKLRIKDNLLKDNLAFSADGIVNLKYLSHIAQADRETIRDFIENEYPNLNITFKPESIQKQKLSSAKGRPEDLEILFALETIAKTSKKDEFFKKVEEQFGIPRTKRNEKLYDQMSDAVTRLPRVEKGEPMLPIGKTERAVIDVWDKFNGVPTGKQLMDALREKEAMTFNPTVTVDKIGPDGKKIKVWSEKKGKFVNVTEAVKTKDHLRDIAQRKAFVSFMLENFPESKSWYTDFNEGMKKLVGEGNMHEFGVITSILSAQSSIDGNIGAAINTMLRARELVAKGKFTLPNLIHAMKPTEKQLAAGAKKLLKNKNGEDVGYLVTEDQIKKIYDFYLSGIYSNALKTTIFASQLIRGAQLPTSSDFSVQDVQQSKIVGFDPHYNTMNAGSINQSRNRFGIITTALIARDMGLKAEEVQGLEWTFARAFIGKSGKVHDVPIKDIESGNWPAVENWNKHNIDVLNKAIESGLFDKNANFWGKEKLPELESVNETKNNKYSLRHFQDAFKIMKGEETVEYLRQLDAGAEAAGAELRAQYQRIRPKNMTPAQRAAFDVMRQGVLEHAATVQMGNYKVNKLSADIKDETTKTERMLLPFLIEKTDPSSLSSVGDPKLKAVAELYADLQHLPGRLTVLESIADRVRDYYNEMWKTIEDNYDIMPADKIVDYITHIWDIPKKNVLSTFNNMSTIPAFLKKRHITTLKEGIDMGLTPKVLDVTDILKTYSQLTNTAMANKAIIDLAKGTGIDQIPVVLLPGDQRARDNNYEMMYIPSLAKWKYVGTTKGKTPMLKHDGLIAVHPAVAPAIRAVFDHGDSPHGLLRAYDNVAAILKKLQLSISLFHHVALTETGVAMMGPLKTIKMFGNILSSAVVAGRTPTLLAKNEHIALDGLAHGLQLGAAQSDIQTQRIQGWLDKFVFNTRKIPGVNIGARAISGFNKLWDRVLWDYLHDSLKMYAYADAINKMPKKYTKTPELMSQYKQEMSQLINDTFGGQIWQNIMVSPRMERMMRRGLLSADWTVSTMRQALSPFGIGARHAATKKARILTGAAFWARAAAYYYGGMHLLNAYYRKKDEKENPDVYPPGEKSVMDRTMFGNSPGHRTHLFVGRNDDGTERYVRWGKQFREIFELGWPVPLHIRRTPDGSGKLTFDASDTELLALSHEFYSKVGGKANPLLQLAAQALTGRTLSGYENKLLVEKGYFRDGPEFARGMLITLAQAILPFSMKATMDDMLEESGVIYGTDKQWSISDLMFPSSKGLSPGEVTAMYKDAMVVDKTSGELIGLDVPAILETYYYASLNKLDAYSLFESALTGKKAEASRDLSKTERSIEAIDKQLARKDLTAAQEEALEDLKDKLVEREERIKSNWDTFQDLLDDLEDKKLDAEAAKEDIEALRDKKK